jgi:hypothetical protein
MNYLTGDEQVILQQPKLLTKEKEKSLIVTLVRLLK